MSSAEPFVVMAKPVGPICNLDCGYCYYLGKKALFPPQERFRMTPEVLESYISSFIASSPGPLVHFGWHGGEPTLAGIGFYRRVVELQERYLPPGWRCVNNIQTNGTLLDERWCSLPRREPLCSRAQHRRPGERAQRLSSRPARTAHPRPGHVGARRCLRAAGIEPDVLCTLNALDRRSPERGLPVLCRPEGAMAAVPPGCGESTWRRCVAALGDARGDGGVPLHDL